MIFDSDHKQICRIVKTIEMLTQPFYRVNFRRIHLNLNIEIAPSEKKLNVLWLQIHG